MSVAPQATPSAVCDVPSKRYRRRWSYAEATGADVRLSRSDGRLTIEVVDDGRGFDPAATALGTRLQGVSGRLGALGGFLEVRPGTGTTVAGWIPAEDTRERPNRGRSGAGRRRERLRD